MNKRFIGIVIASILLIAGFIWATQPKADSPSGEGAASNHTYGEGAKGVTLIEYGDFQCPACRAYYPIVKDLKEKFKADITFQFRNLPLEQIHQNARAAARAAEAAAMQDKFWEMHDVLYENQDAWKDSSDPLSMFNTYAQQIGIADTSKFASDYRSSAVNGIINADLKEAQKISATSTPTFVIDGRKLTENPRDAEAFDKLIVDAIAAKAAPTN